MSAGRYDIRKLDRAATFTMKLICKNDDGTLMSLAGYTAKASIKEHYDDTEALVDFTCDIPIPANGEIFLTLTPLESVVLVNCEYVWDIILVNADYVMRLLDGKVYISPEVTPNE
jgi:hypothetical protein